MPRAISQPSARLAKFIPTGIALLPIAILIFIMAKRPSAAAFDIHTLDLDTPSGARRGLFLLPISNRYGLTGIALDGGELPFLGLQVPRLILGKTGTEEPLRVAFLTDWTSAPCRDAHRALLSIADSLPHSELFILPIATTPAAEAAHRAILAIDRTANDPQTVTSLISEILQGSLAPEPAAIFARLASLDPELNTRLDPAAEWIIKHADDAFVLARAQLARNSSLTSLDSPPQLTTFDAVLSGVPAPEVLSTFFREASARQVKRLATHPAVHPPGTIIRCECQDPSHRHASPLAMEYQLSASPPPPASEN